MRTERGKAGPTEARSLAHRLKAFAHRLEVETYALYLAFKDSRTPWYARLWVALVIVYTFSPIDLIPDFIPVLGYLDDLIVTPLGIWLALKMIPPEVMQDAREQAVDFTGPGKIVRLWGVVLVISTWLLATVLLVRLIYYLTYR